jgi:hypothetical protein
MDKYFKIASLVSAAIIFAICAMVPLWAIMHPDIKGVSVPILIAGLIIAFAGSALMVIVCKESKGTRP